MKVFAIYNLKGGVGKTATAVNLAYVSARAGARTLLWDLDPQGAATFYFRVRPKVKGGVRRMLKRPAELEDKIRGSDYDNLDVLPADFSYRHLDIALYETKNPSRRMARLIKPVRPDYDHLVFDCSPGMSLVSESVLEMTDVLLIPTIPTPLSLRSLVQMVKHVRDRIEKPPRIIPFFSMVDRRKTMHRSICEDPRGAEIGFPETVIPYSSVVEQMGVHRAPLPHTMPSHAVSRAYGQLWDEVLAAAADGDADKPPSPKRLRRMLDSAVHPIRSNSA